MAATQAVLFDLDDTLVDHQQASGMAVAGIRLAFAALRACDVDVLLAENDRLVEELHADVRPGRRTADDARIERHRRLFAFAGAQVVLRVL